MVICRYLSMDGTCDERAQIEAKSIMMHTYCIDPGIDCFASQLHAMVFDQSLKLLFRM